MEKQKDPRLEKFSFEQLNALPRGQVHEFTTPLRDRQGHLKMVITDMGGIVDGTMIADKAVPALSHYNDSAFVEMNFMLEGSISQTYEGLLKQYQYKTGYHNILFNPYSAETNQLMMPGTHHIFSVHMLADRMAGLFRGYLPEFEALADKIEKGERFVLHGPSRAMDSRLRSLLYGFWDRPPQGSSAKLFFDARILELLSRQFEILSGLSAAPVPDIRKADLERLYHVKELISNNLETPLPLGELARQSGLSELKLKQYFRQVFRQGVYGFLCEERLRRARQMINEGEKNVSAIAYELGYAHPQHFHRAFKKRFGVSPGSLLR